MSDQYQYWRDALDGKKPPIHEGDAQPGFYRKRNKPFNGKPRADDPVAIWEAEGKMVALVGTAQKSKHVDAAEIWTWIADKPISYEEYQEAHEKGAWEKAIAGLDEPRGAGDNNPPADPFEAFKEEADAAVKLAEQAMSKDISTQEDVDRFANIKDRLLQLGKDGDLKRKEEKKPHDDAAAEVQKKWTPILSGVDQAKKKLLGRINDWIRAEEQRRAKEALEAAKAAEAAGEELPVQTNQPVQIGGAVSGRKTSMRTRKTAVIEDPVKFATFLLSGPQPNPDLMDTLQKCANRIAVNGAKADGIRVETQRNAA